MANDLFNAIYDSYHADVYRFIYTISRKDKNFADDIFQNTMKSAFKDIHKLQDIDKAKGWLFSIAKNEASSYFRKNKRYIDVGQTNLIEFDEAVENEQASLEDISLEVVNKVLMAQALNKLNDNEAQIIYLFYYYDMSLNEIADITRANYNTVKSLHRRAIKKLKTILQKELRVNE